MKVLNILLWLRILSLILAERDFKIDHQHFTARIVAFNISTWFKYTENDLQETFISVINYDKNEVLLHFNCGTEKSNCSEMAIAVRKKGQSILAKFFSSPEELGDYSDWKIISNFVVNSTDWWMIFYDDDTGFLLFGQHNLKKIMEEKKIVEIFWEHIGKVPRYKMLGYIFGTKGYCNIQSQVCQNPLQDYFNDRQHSYASETAVNGIIFYIILGTLAIVVCCVFVFVKIFNILAI
jgi:hypothetical protein